MTKSEYDDKAPSARDREATVGILIEHFSRDELSLDEFEQRIDASHAAHTKSALDSLTEDLRTEEAYPPIEESFGETPPLRDYQVATASDIKETELITTVMGGVSHKGPLSLARKSTVLTVMGGTELDLRGCVLAPGINVIQVFCLMGAVEILVPQGVNLEVGGTALMGGFDHTSDDEGSPDSTKPTLRVTGFVCMGGVSVETRHTGETSGEAKRRREQLKRDQRLSRRLKQS